MNIAVFLGCFVMGCIAACILALAFSGSDKSSLYPLIIPVALGAEIWLTLLSRISTINSLMWSIGAGTTLLATKGIVLLLSIVIYLIARKYSLRLDCRKWHSAVWILLLGTSAFLLESYFFTRYYLYRPTTTEFTIHLSAILLATAAIGYLSAVLCQILIERHKEALIQEEMMQFLYEQQHDYKKRLFLLREAPDSHTLEQFIHNEYQTDGLIKLERSILMVLVPYLKQLEEKQIDYEINVTETVPTYNIPYKDMIQILGNTLENALSAAEQVPNARVIINFSYHIGDSRIQIQNPFVTGSQTNEITTLQKRTSKEYQSSSPSSAKHNHGLALIQSALKPYQGKLYTDVCNGIYITEIVVPQEESR